MDNGNINNDDKTNDNNNYARCVREYWMPGLIIVTYEEVYNAYLKCRKGKRKNCNTLKFERDLELNLLEITESINNRTYCPRRSIIFAIDYPKVREIIAADFRDRIVHHVLFNYLNPIFERIFIYDSYACRIGKGTLRAVKRLQYFMRSITENGNKRAFYLQLDISNFFMSIDKEILFKIVSKKIENEEMRWLAEKIVFHNPIEESVIKGRVDCVPKHKRLINQKEGYGLPIGNLTSQFFANVYMNELDQFVKHKLKARYYLRYVDDFVLLSKSRQELLKWKEEIEYFLWWNLKLRLKNLIKCGAVSNGINFTGAIVKQSHLLARNRNVYEMNRKITFFLDDKDFDKKKLRATINSYFGMLGHFSSRRIMALAFKRNKRLREVFDRTGNKVVFRKCINGKV